MLLTIVRLFLLGLHFLLAGLLGLLVGICRPFNPDNSRLFAWLYSRPALPVLGVRLQADVAPMLTQPPGFVIVANHQSNYDLFVLGTLVPPRTVALGKKSLKWLPLFGQLFWLGGNVLVDRSNAHKARRALLNTSRTLRDQNTSIWVFAEGTRNPARTLMPFKKGAFHMAIEAGVPIVPLCVSAYAQSMDLRRWRSARVLVRSLAPIPTTGLGPKDVPALIEQCHAQMQACIDEMEVELQRP